MKKRRRWSSIGRRTSDYVRLVVELILIYSVITGSISVDDLTAILVLL